VREARESGDLFALKTDEAHMSLVVSTLNYRMRNWGRRVGRDDMALKIPNAEAERLATELAHMTGETRTEAVTTALRESLERVRRQRSRQRLADELEAIAEHCASLPVLDPGTSDEILGYDDKGLPR
jgi:antitoxin VapB